MAYTIRKDPGVLVPYEDDTGENKRTVSRIEESFSVASLTSDEYSDFETQTKTITNKQVLTSGIALSYDEITSADVVFPNTQRKRKQDEPYDLTKAFKTKNKKIYSRSAAAALKLLTRVSGTTVSGIDTTTTHTETGASFFYTSTDIPFLPAPGKRMNEDVRSIIVSSPDATKYQYIKTDSPSLTIGAATDKQFSISVWFYLNSEKETILVTKGLTTGTQEYELKVNSDMTISFKTIDTSLNSYIITSSLSVTPNIWNHVVISSTGNDWTDVDALTKTFYKLYINKSIDKGFSTAVAAYDATGTQTSAELLYVGHNGSGDDNNIDGLIAEVAIWTDYYLKKREVAAIYDAATKSLMKMDTTSVDPFRQGVSVTTNKYKNESLLYKLSSNNQRNVNYPDHFVAQREFGQPFGFDGDVPFNDVEGRFSTYDLTTMEILDTNTVQYPVIYDNNIVEPKRENGVLEPLAIRETVFNNSVDSPFQAHRISGELCGGNSNPEFGTIFITNDIKRKEDQQKIENVMINSDCYFDAEEKAFDSVYDEATLKYITFSVPGFVSDVPQEEVTFDDTIDLTANELITETESITSLLMSSPDSSRSNYLIKSAQSGFIYGNNPEGTDSLAYGGLLRK